MIGLINNGLILMGLEYSQQLIARGAIIILAVALSHAQMSEERSQMKLCTIIGMVTAKGETRDEWRRILAAEVAPTRAEAGCMNYDFHVDAEDPNVFVFCENWRSKADLDAHLKAPHLQPLFARLHELLTRSDEMKFLEMNNDRSRIHGLGGTNPHRG